MKYLICWRAIFFKETQKLYLKIIHCWLFKTRKWDYSYTDAFVYYLLQKSWIDRGLKQVFAVYSNSVIFFWVFLKPSHGRTIKYLLIYQYHSERKLNDFLKVRSFLLLAAESSSSLFLSFLAFQENAPRSLLNWGPPRLQSHAP